MKVVVNVVKVVVKNQEQIFSFSTHTNLKRFYSIFNLKQISANHICTSLIKSKVMRCSRYGNGVRMHVILNGEHLKEVDGFKYLRSQVAADGGYEMDVLHRMNGGIERGER